MTMITPSYLGETIEYSSLHACRSTLEDPTKEAQVQQLAHWIADVLDGHGDESVIERVRAQVLALCRRFPVYG